MKRIKKTELKKLSIDTTTIRVLTDDDQLKQVVGGVPPRRTSYTCSYEPLTCP
jgi:hypothetical protein